MFNYSFLEINFVHKRSITKKTLHILLLLQIFIKSNTSYYEKGQLVTQKPKILFHYLKTHFFLDFITIYCLSNEIFQKDFSLLFILRLFYDNGVWDKIRMKIVLKDKLRGIFDLCILLIKVIFLCHFFACAYYICGQNQTDWLEKYDLETASVG